LFVFLNKCTKEGPGLLWRGWGQTRGPGVQRGRHRGGTGGTRPSGSRRQGRWHQAARCARWQLTNGAGHASARLPVPRYCRPRRGAAGAAGTARCSWLGPPVFGVTTLLCAGGTGSAPPWAAPRPLGAPLPRGSCPAARGHGHPSPPLWPRSGGRSLQEPCRQRQCRNSLY